jgi:hypothetical protein
MVEFTTILKKYKCITLAKMVMPGAKLKRVGAKGLLSQL